VAFIGNIQTAKAITELGHYPHSIFKLSIEFSSSQITDHITK